MLTRKSGTEGRNLGPNTASMNSGAEARRKAQVGTKTYARRDGCLPEGPGHLAQPPGALQLPHVDHQHLAWWACRGGPRWAAGSSPRCRWRTAPGRTGRSPPTGGTSAGEPRPRAPRRRGGRRRAVRGAPRHPTTPRASRRTAMSQVATKRTTISAATLHIVACRPKPEQDGRGHRRRPGAVPDEVVQRRDTGPPLAGEDRLERARREVEAGVGRQRAPVVEQIGRRRRACSTHGVAARTRNGRGPASEQRAAPGVCTTNGRDRSVRGMK